MIAVIRTRQRYSVCVLGMPARYKVVGGGGAETAFRPQRGATARYDAKRQDFSATSARPATESDSLPIVIAPIRL